MPLAPDFGERESEEAAGLIRRALREDLPAGDATTDSLFGAGGPAAGRGWIIAGFVPRSRGIVCGIPVVNALFRQAGGGVSLRSPVGDGTVVEPDRPFLQAEGPPAPILRLERIALNFLGRLSGIATLTRRFREALEGTQVKLLDTRKTLPGWRRLEKYAVRAGGGENHRPDLSSAILLKDNHAEVLRALGRGGFREWVACLRRSRPDAFVEVEVGGREEFLEALGAGADCILLDNFQLEDIHWAVQTRDAHPGVRPLLEASGGIRLERVREVALAGVDRVSAGALTHSAAVLDIGLDLIFAREEAPE